MCFVVNELVLQASKFFPVGFWHYLERGTVELYATAARNNMPRTTDKAVAIVPEHVMYGGAGDLRRLFPDLQT